MAPSEPRSWSRNSPSSRTQRATRSISPRVSASRTTELRTARSSASAFSSLRRRDSENVAGRPAPAVSGGAAGSSSQAGSCARRVARYSKAPSASATMAKSAAAASAGASSRRRSRALIGFASGCPACAGGTAGGGIWGAGGGASRCVGLRTGKGTAWIATCAGTPNARRRCATRSRTLPRKAGGSFASSSTPAVAPLRTGAFKSPGASNPGSAVPTASSSTRAWMESSTHCSGQSARKRSVISARALSSASRCRREAGVSATAAARRMNMATPHGRRPAGWRGAAPRSFPVRRGAACPRTRVRTTVRGGCRSPPAPPAR